MMIKNLLCLLGFHYWVYIEKWDRKCTRCKKHQERILEYECTEKNGIEIVHRKWVKKEE